MDAQYENLHYRACVLSADGAELGDLDDAIELAAKMANIDDYKIVEYPTIKENPFKDIIKAFEDSNVSIKSGFLRNAKAKKMFNTAKDIETLIQMEGPMARMPFIISDY